MNDYSLTKLYEILQEDLKLWVINNYRLRNKITAHNLNYLFEFHKRKGLSIDLCRFEREYYHEVFHPPEDQQEVITAFVRKAINVIKCSLIRLGKEELSITITIRNKPSLITYWHTYYVGSAYESKNITLLSRKLEDWQ